ncbi:class II D-tagatose-bisphosphate aldolase, non-catalytic subunit [Shewanella litorisediminis]|uniref:Class II D-tagatose-bisphosphate aldolase, non-catalytic subunit n=1 Tax=Shewanella litorisediminis TaxID=1173586 RepID=A0ABX7G6M5_9GAMM|nr:class II D-tagatose-bisphosphate aldolase, non-catalytic subunit [Shewanella litorisediminis]MCL2916903.1 class II D-tagatose-bisphosphate aldolase, non-catalytic subunit [Shewanella litorisediminis]QRH02932.1 class II D-tagatose-bisphosphate aldolase, non-catalytic subunit [Shewanella litorisediminis]
MSVLKSIIEANKRGEQRGIFAVCSAQPLVLRAALRHGVETGSPVLIEATANQVNQFGGYTGMMPADFIRFVECLAEAEGLPRERLLFGGDHLGPVAWKHLPADEAMDNAEAMVRAFVEAGFEKIHLDASMGCQGEVEPLGDSLIAARAARLCKAAEEAACGRPLCYVIGTEVPPPGGVASLHALEVTPVPAIEQTVAAHRMAFDAAGLSDAVWQRVIALVVQPGVEFGHSDIHQYNSSLLDAQRRFIRRQPGLVYEAHSTDYQLPEHYKSLVADHFAILKVGPELTFALREALFALDHIEALLVPQAKRAGLRALCEDKMQADPKFWQHFYTDPQARDWQLGFSYSDRIRYYWPELSQAIDTLLFNLKDPIPLPLISQYLPLQYSKVLRQDLPATALSLVLDHISLVLERYEDACQLSAIKG